MNVPFSFSRRKKNAIIKLWFFQVFFKEGLWDSKITSSRSAEDFDCSELLSIGGYILQLSDAKALFIMAPGRSSSINSEFRRKNKAPIQIGVLNYS